MHFRRELTTSYILVFGGLLLGLFVGIFVIEYDPPVVAWLFAAGGGMALGAFVAALVSGVPLVGNPGTGRRYVPRDDIDDEVWRDHR